MFFCLLLGGNSAPLTHAFSRIRCWREKRRDRRREQGSLSLLTKKSWTFPGDQDFPGPLLSKTVQVLEILKIQDFLRCVVP